VANCLLSGKVVREDKHAYIDVSQIARRKDRRFSDLATNLTAVKHRTKFIMHCDYQLAYTPLRTFLPCLLGGQSRVNHRGVI
jgi:hypothetical protein